MDLKYILFDFIKILLENCTILLKNLFVRDHVKICTYVVLVKFELLPVVSNLHLE